MKNYMICLTAAIGLIAFTSCENEEVFQENATISEDQNKNTTQVLTEEISFYRFNESEGIEEVFVQEGTPPAQNSSFTFRSDEDLIALPVPRAEIILQAPENYGGAFIQIKDATGTILPGFYNVQASVFDEEDVDVEGVALKSKTASIESRKQKSIANYRKKSAKRERILAKSKNQFSSKSFDVCELFLTDLEINLATVLPQKFSLLISAYDTDGNVGRVKEVALEVIPVGGNDNLIGEWTFEKYTIIDTNSREKGVFRAEDPDCFIIEEVFGNELFCLTTDDFEEFISPSELEECITASSTYVFNNDGTYTSNGDVLVETFILDGPNCDRVIPDSFTATNTSLGKWGVKDGQLIVYGFQETFDGEFDSNLPLDATEITDNDFNFIELEGEIRLRGDRFILRDAFIDECFGDNLIFLDEYRKN